MHGAWDTVVRVEDAALAGSGLANALYFARRIAGSRGPRRLAALVLATLFAGLGLDGLAAWLGLEAGASAAGLRAPLVLGSVATSLLVFGGRTR
jgi:hypothetical protein